jgi:SCY1-like protein 1
VSIFEYDFGDPTKKNSKHFATNALRKLKTTRHPDVLKFVDAVETDSIIYILTERVIPLQNVLKKWTLRETQEREDWLLWGLHRISVRSYFYVYLFFDLPDPLQVALAFLNDPCLSTHGNVCINSIFISPSGEWKLGGFELLSSKKDDLPVLYVLSTLLNSIGNLQSDPG